MKQYLIVQLKIYLNRKIYIFFNPALLVIPDLWGAMMSFIANKEDVSFAGATTGHFICLYSIFEPQSHSKCFA